MRINLDSVFFFVGQAVARHMIARRRGKIINIDSLKSEAASYLIAPYTASKGAVKNLIKGMCADWADAGGRSVRSVPCILRPRSTTRWPRCNQGGNDGKHAFL